MLTSRERVRNALTGKPNDRLPYDFRAEPEVYDLIKNEKDLVTDEDVRIWADSDVRDIGMIFAEGGYGGYSGFGWKERTLPDGTQEDFWGVRRTKVSYEGGYYVDICRWPLKDASAREIADYDWPDAERIFDFSDIPAKVRSLNQGNEYWCITEIESLFDRCWCLRGMEQFMSDMLTEPELADLILTRMSEFFYRRTEMMLEAADGCLDAVGLYNDLGTQKGMMISPSLYREFIKPRQKRLIELAKSYGVSVFYHSCGSIEPILDDLIEIGVDIIDPLQMTAMKVTPEHLAEKYSGRITFHGGLDTQTFLQHATPEEVTAEVRHLARTLGRDGRYILAGSHFYQVDIPFANLEAIHAGLRDA